MAAVAVIFVTLVASLATISLVQAVRQSREDGSPLGHAVLRRAGVLLGGFAMAMPEVIVLVVALAVLALRHALA